MSYEVGIVGVGNMGGGMALNLLAKGWKVHVCDLDNAKTEILKKKGAIVHIEPAQLAIHSIVNIVCVVDAAQSHEVLFGPQGLASGLSPGRTVMLCPTLAPQDVEGFAQTLQPRAIQVIDAPMSGGPQRAVPGFPAGRPFVCGARPRPRTSWPHCGYRGALDAGLVTGGSETEKSHQMA